MSQDITPVPPESAVIRLARMALGMTAESAAAASRMRGVGGVSAAYWRDVERGTGGRRGRRVPTRASARALAAMACTVGVSPAELAGAGRQDAATVLEEIRRREGVTIPLATVTVPPREPARTGEVVPFPPRKPLAEIFALHRGESDIFPEMDESMTAQVERHLPAVEAAVIFAAAGSETPVPQGAEVFPGIPHEIERWDTLVKVGLGLFPERAGFSLWQLAMLASVGRVRDDERRAGNPAARAREA